jgi:hypothetical protein
VWLPNRDQISYSACRIGPTPDLVLRLNGLERQRRQRLEGINVVAAQVQPCSAQTAAGPLEIQQCEASKSCLSVFCLSVCCGGRVGCQISVCLSMCLSVVESQ